MRRSITLAALLAAAAAAVAPAAQAHVTLQPAEVPAGGFTRLNVRVPNERDDANTTKVEVQFPADFLSASYEPTPGWTVAVKNTKLAKPVEEFGERKTERVDTVTFSTSGKGIAPGQFQDFGLSLKMPDKPSTLTFKALQTYSNGEVVRWIGTPDADEPAPQVKLTAAKTEGDAGAKVDVDVDDDDGNTLAVIALIAGALGLLAGGAALITARRRAA